MTKIRDREQVVAVAGRLFAENGYEATRLEDIAAELGIVRGALYYYVTSKAELRMLVANRRLRQLIDEVAGIANSGRPPAEKVSAIVKAHVLHFDRFFPESRGWFPPVSLQPERDEQAEELHCNQNRYERLLRGVIRDGVDDREFRADLDVTLAAIGILGMCNWMSQWYRRDGRLSAGEIADRYATMALSALTARRID